MIGSGIRVRTGPSVVRSVGVWSMVREWCVGTASRMHESIGMVRVMVMIMVRVMIMVMVMALHKLQPLECMSRLVWLGLWL